MGVEEGNLRVQAEWRKWAVLVGSFLNHVIVWGAAWGSGVFQMIFLEAFKGRAALVSVVPTLIPAIMSFIGPVVSALTNRLGCRWVTALGTAFVAVGFASSAAANSLVVLCATFAAIGLGVGLVFIPSIVILTHHFRRRLPLAVAVASSGLGVGVFLFPPFIRALDAVMGWRGAVLIYAAVSLLMLFSAWAFREEGASPPPLTSQISTTSTASSRRRKTLRVKMMRQAPFLCLVLNNVLLLYGIVGFYIHLPSYIRSLPHPDTGEPKFTKSEAAMFPSVAGVSTLVCRLLVGLLVQQIQAPVSLYTGSMILAGLAVISIAFLESHGALMMACVVYGFGSATLGPLLPLIMRELVGSEAIGDGYGYVMVAEGLGSLLGPPVAGALFDATDSYQFSLCCAGGAMILSSLVMALPLWHVWSRSSKSGRAAPVLLANLGDCTTSHVHPSQRGLAADASGAMLLPAETEASLTPMDFAVELYDGSISPSELSDPSHLFTKDPGPTDSVDSGVVDVA